MSSRFPTLEHFDFCYHPVRLSKNGVVMYVPCGKCNGCLLQKANDMSFRLGDEIENSHHSIFTTFTYDNHYVPKMECRVEEGQFHWFSAPDNWRYNGHFDVLRDPIDFYSPYTLKAPLHNYKRNGVYVKNVVGYVSKSDIQLYLKLLRKDIYDNFNISRGSLRYYIVSEYGPGKDPNKGKFRPHYHAIFFPCNKEIASFLMEFGLFKSWQMCDPYLFKHYTRYCDSGARHYVTEYVTGTSKLPSLLQASEEVRPFALMSKQVSAIGTCAFDTKKVLQDIELGIDEYRKRVPRIERNYIFRYPSKVTTPLFPKCGRFNQLSFDGLLRIYEYVYNFRRFGKEASSLSYVLYNDTDQVFPQISVQDYTASKACAKVCEIMNWTPFHYVEVLVEFYYRKAQAALRYQYEFQQQHINDPYLCIGFYNNWQHFLNDANGLDCSYPLYVMRRFDSRLWFLQSFGVSVPLDEFKVKSAIDNSLYMKEVDSIIENADKSKKVNAKVGLSPHIV